MTDFQRIVIYFSTVTAVFLAAMALGWQNVWLLVAAIAVLVVSGAGLMLAVARRGAGAHEIATAQVISVSAPPPNVGIAARCDMQLEVRLAGRPPVRTKHRDPAVPLTRWPRPGQTFPVDVYGGNPRRRLHIRWDLVEQGLVAAPDQSSSQGASTAPMWEEENEPIVYSPTPPRPRRPAPSPPPAPPPQAPPADALASTVFLHETFTDLDDETAQTAPPREATSAPDPPAPRDTAATQGAPPPPDTSAAQAAPPTRGPSRPPSRPTTDGDPNGHDPDGYDPADFEAPRLTAPPAVTGGPGFEAITLTDFDPAEVDIRDFTGEPPAVTIPPDDENPAPPPATTSPPAPAEPARSGEAPSPERPSAQPLSPERPSAQPLSPQPLSPQPPSAQPPPIPMPRDPGDPARGGQGISTTLPVADLSRALGFYRDALGFTVTVTSGDSAVVEHQGTRIRLETGDAGPASSENIHIDVVDIEASCAAAEAHAGTIIERPAPVGTGGDRRLWRARLRDPDGHAVELMQWRQGDG